MKLKRIISGGQTGADRTALEEAKALGIPTGGYAPRGYRTEDGPDPSLKEFGLVETASSDYPSRTRLNAVNSECTVWFGETNSSGFRCTDKFAKTMFVNPDPKMFAELCDLYEIINIAGNRKSKNPGVVDLVKSAFAALGTCRCGSQKSAGVLYCAQCTAEKKDEWAYGSGPNTLAGNTDL